VRAARASVFVTHVIQVSRLNPEIACTGSGLQKIQDEISRGLLSLKNMEESACVEQEPDTIQQLSSSALKQISAFVGGHIYEYEEIRDASAKLSHITEKLRMATSHVFTGIREFLEESKIPNYAHEAFIWMQFTECYVDIDDEIDAKHAFPIANETGVAPVCIHCKQQDSSDHSSEDRLRACSNASVAVKGRYPRCVWSCTHHFHMSCRKRELDRACKSKQLSKTEVQDSLVEKKKMFSCFHCLMNAVSKKKKFPAAKLTRAAGIGVPEGLRFCEIYASIPHGQANYVVKCVKPGVFPFLKFGLHHSERKSGADWQNVDYWIEASPPPQEKSARSTGDATEASSAACTLVERDLLDGKVWTFLGDVQVQRCARVGTVSHDALRKCGVKESAEFCATQLMKKMRLASKCAPEPNEKWKVISAKKVEKWKLALARDNGDVVVAEGAVALSGLQPDMGNLPHVPTRTLSVQENDSHQCAAERVVWNCDGTVLAASCQDHRVATWENESDIKKHAVDSAVRNVKRSTCQWRGDGPVVAISWSPVDPDKLLVATPRSCFVLKFQISTATSCASISVLSAYPGFSDITCATFGSNGLYVAVGTQTSGWFAIDWKKHGLSSSNVPLGSSDGSVLAICALPVPITHSSDCVDLDGRDFAVACRAAASSVIHIWKYSEFRCKYEVVKDLRLPSSSDVTALLCSRDSDSDAHSFKILALNGTSTGFLINYVGCYCYDSFYKPIEFWCPMEKKAVNVARASWGAMAATIAFCDFSSDKCKEIGNHWWGLPRLYELWRGQTEKEKCISKHWQTYHREPFGRTLTCDLSVHTVVCDGDALDKESKDGRVFEKIWNYDVALHQQLVNDVADHWKAIANGRNISGDVVEKVVQLIAVTPLHSNTQCCFRRTFSCLSRGCCIAVHPSVFRAQCLYSS
jgi:hypothetical protein